MRLWTLLLGLLLGSSAQAAGAKLPTPAVPRFELCTADERRRHAAATARRQLRTAFAARTDSLRAQSA